VPQASAGVAATASPGHRARDEFAHSRRHGEQQADGRRPRRNNAVLMQPHDVRMHVLRTHGLPDTSLQDVFRAVVVSRIEYTAPAWSGMCSAADRTRLDSLL